MQGNYFVVGFLSDRNFFDRCPLYVSAKCQVIGYDKIVGRMTVTVELFFQHFVVQIHGNVFRFHVTDSKIPVGNDIIGGAAGNAFRLIAGGVAGHQGDWYRFGGQDGFFANDGAQGWTSSNLDYQVSSEDDNAQKDTDGNNLWKAENNPLPCRLMLTYKF
jgi:hypothetical protein